MDFNRKQRFSIRKLTVGVASVLVGTLVLTGKQHTVLAEGTDSSATSSSSDEVLVPASETTTSLTSEQEGSDKSYAAPAISNVDKSAEAVTAETPNGEKTEVASSKKEGEKAEKELEKATEKVAEKAPANKTAEKTEVEKTNPKSEKTSVSEAEKPATKESQDQSAIADQANLEVVAPVAKNADSSVGDALVAANDQVAASKATNQVSDAYVVTDGLSRDERRKRAFPKQGQAIVSGSAFRADTTPTVNATVAPEGPTSYNKSGFGTNPADGAINNLSHGFGTQDFSDTDPNVTTKSATVDKQYPSTASVKAADLTENELGAITYNWKEKKVYNNIDGWTISRPDGLNYVTLVKPEEPTNYDASKRPDGKYVTNSKIYNAGGTIAPSNTVIGVDTNAANGQIEGTNLPSSIQVTDPETGKLGPDASAKNGGVVGMNMAKNGFYMELGVKGTKISKNFTVMPGSQIYLHALTGGAYGHMGTPSTGEHVIVTVKDAKTGAVIKTAPTNFNGTDGEANLDIKPGPGRGSSDYASRIYEIPAGTDQIEVSFEAGDIGQAAKQHNWNFTDGYLVGGLDINVGPALELRTNVRSGGQMNEYGSQNLYKDKQQGEFEVYLKNVGGINPYSQTYDVLLEIPKGIQIDPKYTTPDTGWVWFGDTPINTANKGVEYITVDPTTGKKLDTPLLKVRMGINDRIKPNGNGERGFRLPFTIEEGFKGTATIGAFATYVSGVASATENVQNVNISLERYNAAKQRGTHYSADSTYTYGRTLYIDSIKPASPTIKSIHTDGIRGESTATGQPRQVIITPPKNDKVTSTRAEQEYVAASASEAARTAAEAANDTTQPSYIQDANTAIADQAKAVADDANKGTVTLSYDVIEMDVEFPTPNGGKKTIKLTKKYATEEDVKNNTGKWYQDSTELAVDADGNVILPIPADVDLVEGQDNLKITATDKAGNVSDPGKADVINEAPRVNVGNKKTVFYKKKANDSDDVLRGYGQLTTTDLEDDRDGVDTTEPTISLVDKGNFDATVPGTYTITVKSTDSEGKDSTTDTYEVVVLDLITVNPDAPKTPGTSVDPDDPSKGVYPPGVAKDDLNKEVKRTVHFKDDKGATVFPDNENTVKYTRVATANPDTKEVTYTDWAAKDGDHTFDAVTAPVKDGYYADKANVPAKELSTDNAVVPTLTNEEETITYKPLGSWVAKVPQADGSTTDNTTKYPNDPNDPTTTGTPTNTIPYVEGYTPTANGTPLTLKDPANPSAGYNPPAVPADKGMDTVITYDKDAQVATVNFKDESNAKVAEPITLNGKSGDTMPKDAVDSQIQALKDKGYTVVTNGFDPNGTAPAFDKDKKTNQSFDVVVKPVVVEVTPDKPATPGTSIDPTNPTGPKYPATGLNEADLNKTIKRTITYKNEAGETVAPSVEQNVKFTRKATVNAVKLAAGDADAITYGDWESADPNYPEKTSPVVTGYIADKKVVPTETVASTDTDKEEPVVYKKLGSWVANVPGTDGTPTPVKTQYPNNPDDPTKPGTPTDQTVPYVEGYTPKVNGTPLELKDPKNPDLGYKVPEIPADATTDVTIDYTKDDQKAIVKFVNKADNNAELGKVEVDGKSGEEIDQTTANAKLTEYINQGYEVVSNELTDDKEVKKFDKDATTDQTFVVTLQPKIVTVNPNDPKTPGTPIDPNNPTGPQYPAGLEESNLNKSVTRTVTYTNEDGTQAPAAHAETVKFTRTATVNAVTKEVTYGPWTAENGDSTYEEVPTPVQTGYIADKATVPAKTIATTDAAVEAAQDETVPVTYKKLGSWVVTPPTGTPTETVYPNNPQDPTKPGTPTQTVPYVPGFTPVDGNNKPLTLVDPTDPSQGYKVPDVPTDPTQNTNITYVKADQKATVNFVNQSNNNALLDTVNVTGKSEEAIPTTDITAKLDALKAKGYEVVTNPFDNAQNFDNNQAVDQTFEVVLREKTTTVDPNDPNVVYPEGVTENDLKKDITRTVTYVDNKGNSVEVGITDKVTFTRTATVNAVTGKVTFGEWTAKDNDTTFDEVKSPVVNGYVANKASIPATTGITPTSKDENHVVIYSPLGKVVITNPDGSTEEVPYTNNPTDPTKPNDTNVVPYKPGQTPKDKEGNPLEPVNPNKPEEGYKVPTPTDPSKDTPVHYDSDTQKAVVKFVNEKDKAEIAKVELDGQSGKAIPTTDVDAKLTELKAKGYEVVTDEFANAADKKFDSDSQTDQTYVVTLREKTVEVTPEDPKNPGDKVNPNDPTSPNYPDGVKQSDLNKQVVRNVEYVNADGTVAPFPHHSEALNFKRTATVNLVTGAVTYGDWTSTDNTFDAVPTPVQPGYVADIKEVLAETIATDDASVKAATDKTVKVTYKKLGS